MVKEKEVNVHITNRNKGYYKSIGFNCNSGDTIIVSIEALYSGTHLKITAICDNPECNSSKPLSYEVYNRIINFTPIHKYYCNKCSELKKLEMVKQLQIEGKLTRKDQYYWTFEENRKKEFLNYINNNNSLSNLVKNDYGLYNAILEYEDGYVKYAEKLGINIEEYLKDVKKPNNYYTKEYILKCIEDFINKNNRFPSQQDLQSLYKINSRQFNKYFKSFNDCKKEISYYNKDDLIDNRGDVNRSYYELYTANFLIAQGFKEKYTREEYPFEGRPYRSDFTLYPKNQNHIHIEVWADNKNAQFGHNFFESYIKVREEKEKLYKQHSDKITLISIEPNTFQGSLKNIERNLYNIFKDYLDLEYEIIDTELLLPYNSIAEEEILNLLLVYSGKLDKLPSKKEIIKHKGGYTLLKHIEKRFGGLNYFANKYNLKTSYKRNYWNEEKVYTCFDYMLKTYRHFCSSAEYSKEKDSKLKGLYQFIQKNGGYLSYKIKYINSKVTSDLILSPYLLDLLYNIANNTVKYVYQITLEQQQIAQQILSQYNTKITKSA